ncbi:hypothetical protein BDW42DRAFT_166737 [Aspergillus taichungensis]|uniref:Uncharacterized protein n=1 Tax=Aspergillus taichungensis TaxID=482145 RepID=A0A2J5HYI9_9EURO|nr:hypothetical protein BDW42DRAFT_166737 [Aspergillus taichungensis]
MLGSFLGWFFYLFDPLANLAIPPIQPQARLRPENNVPVAAEGPWEDIITGHYGVPPLIRIHDRDGIVKWKFERDDVQQDLPDEIRKCLYSSANDATELKWIRNGTAVAAVYSALALIINHTPDNPETDKLITWAICRDNEFLWNAHTLEPLPGDRMAVGTTGQRPWDGVLVYNTSEALPLDPSPPILQNVTGLRAIHGLIWDEAGSALWAAGTDFAADGSDPEPARATIHAYPFDEATGLLQADDAYVYRLDEPIRQEVEWGAGFSWWVGAHDLVPIPNQRKFLISEDHGLHAFDIPTGRFTEHNAAVADKYMPGFRVTTNDRHGVDGDGVFQELPYGDLKGFSIAPDGSFIYVQSLWQKYRGNHTSIVENGVYREINQGLEIYRSRWFGNIDGWPKPL